MLILKKIEKFDKRKQHLCELPLITTNMSCWDYPISPDDAAAFVYTIYTEGDVARHYNAKGALYSALTFLDRTDLRERGIPIYFAIQDTDYDDLQPYFEAAGVKPEFVIPFAPIAYGVLKIMDAFYLPDLQKYERLFMIDPDVFARPTKKYPLVDKILWDTKKYDIAALEPYYHYNGLIDPNKYNELHEMEQLHKFPKFSETPQPELVQTLIEPSTDQRVYIIAWFVGLTQKFLGHIKKPFKDLAQFSEEVYNNTQAQHVVTEEDLLAIGITEFRAAAYDLSQSIPCHTYFVEDHKPYRNTSVINHIHASRAYDGEEEFSSPYQHWKNAWLTEAAATIKRLT